MHRITDRGDVRVQYEGCSNRWTFHTGALTKVHVFNVDDMVKVSDNAHVVKEKQKGHGEWTESMRTVSYEYNLMYENGKLCVQLENSKLCVQLENGKLCVKLKV